MSYEPQHQARKLAALLPPLLVEAERVAQSVNPGTHGRRRAGGGESFWQFRHYAAGDAASSIDWRASARGERLYVREREWEAAQTVYLWADTSGSMRYKSENALPEKAERTQVLMLALAALLLRGGEKCAWLGAEPITVQGKAGLERIAASGDFNRTDASFPPDAHFARFGHMILCSDFLGDPGEWQNRLRRYASLGLKGALVHIADPAEEEFPFAGRIEMQGCENEAPLLVKQAAALRDAYIARMAEHKARLITYAQSMGWLYLHHVTSAPPQMPLLQLYRHLEAGRKSRTAR